MGRTYSTTTTTTTTYRTEVPAAWEPDAVQVERNGIHPVRVVGYYYSGTLDRDVRVEATRDGWTYATAEGPCIQSMDRNAAAWERVGGHTDAEAVLCVEAEAVLLAWAQDTGAPMAAVLHAMGARVEHIRAGAAALLAWEAGPDVDCCAHHAIEVADGLE